MVVRHDGQVCIVKWYDNKPVILASSVEGAEPLGQCRRWCKKTKQYILVDRPHVVESYNQSMGGVDFLDRIISDFSTHSKVDSETDFSPLRFSNGCFLD